MNPVDQPITRCVTEWLDAARDGDARAWGRLIDLVYPELKRLARSARFGRANGTLDTTALVHECYLKLSNAQDAPKDRGHLLSLAVRIMRQLLVDHARERSAQKRGSGAVAVTLDEAKLAAHGQPAQDAFQQLLDIDSALQRLAEVEPRQAKVFECRYFGGLNDVETAEALGISPRTAHRDWDAGRAWLAQNV